MKFSKNGTFLTHGMDEMKKVLRDVPADYEAWVNCVDSIYPVTGVQGGIIDDMVSISSIETYGRQVRSLTVKEVMDQLKAFTWNPEICLEAASDVDPGLDMQLDSPRWVSGWGIDDVCRMFFVISGKDINY